MVITVDVREDLRQGRDVLPCILDAASSLDPQSTLRLIAPFKPTPLIRLLDGRGFSHEAHPLGADVWEVRFARTPAPVRTTGQPAGELPASAPAKVAIHDVDARGLEPPQPLMCILEQLAVLPDGAQLRAHTDRRPMHLYDHLRDRGYTGETEELDDGSFLTHIRPA